MKLRKLFKIVDYIGGVSEFIIHTSLAICISIMVLMSINDPSALILTGTILGTMAPMVSRPMRSPMRLGFYVLGQVLVLTSLWFGNYPHVEYFQSGAFLGFINAMVILFMVRDWFKSLNTKHLNYAVRVMDELYGLPWWEKRYDGTLLWKKKILKFLRSKPVRKKQKPSEQSEQEHLQELLLEYLDDLEGLRKHVPSTPPPPERFDHGIPEVLQKTRQEFVGDDGRKYVIEHKLSVVDDDCT